MSLTPAEDVESLSSTSLTTLHSQRSDPTAELPYLVIEPGARRRLKTSLRELWTYHELLYFLAWRDVKVRYKQTLLGVLWVVLQPLCMMLVFSLFFGRLMAVPSEGIPYPLFAFAGLLPWTFLSTAITVSANSIVNSANLMTKVYFPRLLVPLAAVIASAVDLFITFIVLGGLLVYYRVGVSVHFVAVPFLILLLITLALACGILSAALNVRYRDVKIILPFLTQLWFFGTPIIYPSTIFPPRWRWIIFLNPAAGIIDGFRTAFFGHKAFPISELAVACALTVALLMFAVMVFRRMEKSFADII